MGAGIGAIALGFRALRGGAVVVGVTIEEREPRIVLSSFLVTGAEGDRLSLEPYTVAAEMKRGPGGEVSIEARKAVAEGRRRQDQLAAQGLSDIVARLRDQGYDAAVAALLANRAGWITDLLEHSLSAPEHPPIAEGLAVRGALRYAFGRIGLRSVELDEKSLPEQASAELGLASDELDACLKALGAEAGRPWRKEQKFACLAAWVALSTAR
jgi:hypothetical protein